MARKSGPKAVPQALHRAMARAGLPAAGSRSPYLGALKYHRIVRVNPLPFARTLRLLQHPPARRPCASRLPLSPIRERCVPPRREPASAFRALAYQLRLPRRSRAARTASTLVPAAHTCCSSSLISVATALSSYRSVIVIRIVVAGRAPRLGACLHGLHECNSKDMDGNAGPLLTREV